ncbi:hypothetical protein DSO57_1012966 [Entomophthora muscae]|uniref:Uncharacterized protein n=1 Tax=Entomophthora muscae TaxID=34485 RepID=A0ACC2TGM4_9FUNG|nr:hypothetical protein DSO57_1012966 [Entomophthora muscae]
MGFTPELATPWIDQKAPHTMQRNSPLRSHQKKQWKTILPEAEAAGEFSKKNFTPEAAIEWYDLGASPDKASIFTVGGWNLMTVTNWLHTNHLTYHEIHKYINPTICPAVAIKWKLQGFPFRSKTMGKHTSPGGACNVNV